MTTINKRLELAKDDPHWQLRFLSRLDLDEMDRLLVRDNHPLAFVPGTQESRFIRLARDGHQFA